MKSRILKVECLHTCKLTRRAVLPFKAASDQVIGVRSKLIPRGWRPTRLMCPNFLTRIHPLKNYQNSKMYKQALPILNSCLDSSGQACGYHGSGRNIQLQVILLEQSHSYMISRQLLFLPSNSRSLCSRVSRKPHYQYTVPSALACPQQSRLPLHSTFGISVETCSTGKHSVYTAALPSINQAN